MVESPYSPGRPVVDPRFLRQEVTYDGREAPGTVVINTNERMLYLVQGNGRRSATASASAGPASPGPARTTSPTSASGRTGRRRRRCSQRRPDLPRHMAGGPDNPLGARAMYLGSTLYRIHGSNEPWTIGTQVSSGCIRMRNEDVIDLYSGCRSAPGSW